MIHEHALDSIQQTFFSLQSVFYKKTRRGWQLKKAHISNHYLIWITAGHGLLILDGKKHHLSPGKLFLLIPGITLSTSVHEDNQLQFYGLDFSFKLPAGALNGPAGDAQESFFSQHGELKASCSPELASLFERIYETAHSPNRLVQWKQAILFQELLLSLATTLQQNEQVPSSGSSAIENAARYLQEHYMDDLCLKTVAKLHGISPTNFSSQFKKQTGSRPIDYLTQLRIGHARKWLSVQLPLETVARKVGYQDTLYFSRVFKKVVGISPSLYRNHDPVPRIMTFFAPLNDYLLALQLPPIATLAYGGNDQVNGFSPYLAEHLKETRIVGSWDQPDLQAVEQVKPQIILGINWMNWNQKTIVPVRTLAPTMAITLKDDWRSTLFELANLFGKKERFQRWLHKFEQKAAAAKQQLARDFPLGQTVMILVVTPNGLRIYGGRRQFGEILYRELGLSPPHGVSTKDHYLTVEPEHLTAFDPDHIFLLRSNSNFNRGHIRLLKEYPVWASLKAVQNGRVHEVPGWMNDHAPLKHSISIDTVLGSLIQHG